MKSSSARRPVFLDSTGRRHRAIRRTGAVLAVPVVGYLVLLTSSLFGGPRLDTPLIPLPEAIVRTEHRPHITPPPAAIQTIAPTQPTPGNESQQTTTPSSTPSGTTPSGSPTVVPTTPTVAPTTHTTGSPTAPPGKPTVTPTATTTTTHGSKPTTPPGRTKSPAQP